MCFKSLQVVSHKNPKPFQTMSVTELLSKLASLQRSGNSLLPHTNHKLHRAKGPAIEYMDLPRWKEKASKAAPPNLVAMPAPLDLKSAELTMVALSRS